MTSKELDQLIKEVEVRKIHFKKYGFKNALETGSDAGAGHTIGYIAACTDIIALLKSKKERREK